VKIGYARVSTKDQKLDRQIDQLKEEGVEKIFSEKITGSKKDRTELKAMIQYARTGDTIVVTELTRISRSTKDLISLIDELREKQINVKSLKESWLDTTTATGKLMFTIIAGLAEFERELLRERTKEGLASARARGRCGGRPSVDKAAVEKALKMYETKKFSSKEICEMTGMSRGTLYKYINKSKKARD